MEQTDNKINQIITFIRKNISMKVARTTVLQQRVHVAIELGVQRVRDHSVEGLPRGVDALRPSPARAPARRQRRAHTTSFTIYCY